MKVKLRFLSDKLDSTQTLLDVKNLQLGTAVYTKKFPLNKDIGVLTILENMKDTDNKFQICVKDSNGEILGRGEIFRAKLQEKNSLESIIIYNINNAYFETRDDFYIIELWHEEKLLDRFNLKAVSDIYEVYNNLDDKGIISLI